jgi:hypothetical protein
MERLSRLPWVGSSTPRALVLLASRPDLLAPYFAPVWPVAAIFQGLTQYKLSPLPPLTWDYLRLMSTTNLWRPRRNGERHQGEQRRARTARGY